jgi:pectate lyase
MRIGLIAALIAAPVAAAVTLPAPATSAVAAGLPPQPSQLAQVSGRQALPPGDGWAADGAGTTGGSLATSDHVYTVSNRTELVAALQAAGDAPKIIYVAGTIDANAAADNQPLSCADYAQGTGYTLAGYLAAYDPATWGRTAKPSGPMEVARVAAEKAQGAQVQLQMPSNTTIVGIGPDPTILGGDLYLTSGAANVIVRGLTFANAYDCFPQWDPTDGSTGNWNSQFDNITIIHGANHIWIDHDTFTDQPYPDSQEPVYFGRPFQQHDGATDITDGSDLVTVSWNVYSDHDKTMLVGSTDSSTYDDADHLRVTIHHNEFTDAGQRTPRLRWGHVDVYDNYYAEPGGGAYPYLYSWGVGVHSHIYAQDNYFSLGPGSGISSAQIIHGWGGTEIHTAGNLVNGRPVDLTAAYNAANSPALADDTSWTPTLRTHVDPPQAVPFLVSNFAGACGLA